jgi:hypothetical protein
MIIIINITITPIYIVLELLVTDGPHPPPHVGSVVPEIPFGS